MFHFTNNIFFLNGPNSERKQRTLNKLSCEVYHGKNVR